MHILSVVTKYYADELQTAKQMLFSREEVTMSRHGFTYQGRNVSIPWTADIPLNYRFGSSGAWAVEEALQQTEPWVPGSDTIQTIRLSRSVTAIVAPIGHRHGHRQRVMWGNHRGHKARQVQPSPFIKMDGVIKTRLFTIEMVGNPRSPSLVRAYPGEYMPPLPWMKSAEWADGGRAACVQFWRRHAYIYRDTIVESLTDSAPYWFH